MAAAVKRWHGDFLSAFRIAKVKRQRKRGRTMSKLRHAIFCGFVTLTVLCPLSARADQAFQRFLPLFVDLDGWQGKKPDGMSLDMPNSSMTTATRDYTRGARRRMPAS